jgi:broad specificity phosphatase PhoE
MKIYIIRHEDRTQDATMFSPLTEEGIDNSSNLIDIISSLNVNILYSSPFIRTLQTIFPYSKKKNIKINIDYGISELQHPDLIPPNSYKVYLPKYIANQFNYNDNYTSSMQPIDYQYPECSIELTKRIKKFLKKIITNNQNHSNIILISTHQGVCNTILKIIEKTDTTKLKNFDSKYKYPKGKITQIFDQDKWTFKPINWEY